MYRHYTAETTIMFLVMLHHVPTLLCGSNNNVLGYVASYTDSTLQKQQLCSWLCCIMYRHYTAETTVMFLVMLHHVPTVHCRNNSNVLGYVAACTDITVRKQQ